MIKAQVWASCLPPGSEVSWAHCSRQKALLRLSLRYHYLHRHPCGSHWTSLPPSARRSSASGVTARGAAVASGIPSGPAARGKRRHWHGRWQLAQDMMPAAVVVASGVHGIETAVSEAVSFAICHPAHWAGLPAGRPAWLTADVPAAASAAWPMRHSTAARMIVTGDRFQARYTNVSL